MAKHLADREGGIRAARLIRESLSPKRGALTAKLRQLGLRKNTFNEWERGATAPGFYALQAMALCGYDVVYILTGRKESRNNEVSGGG